MEPLEKFIQPDRNRFGCDPIGYSALAWHRWAAAQSLAGFPVDISKAPSSADLKSPILWLTQAHAIAEAARNVIQNEPNVDHLTIYTKGVCHSQYFAVGLMLVGLSLETCLKAMLILREGVEEYSIKEKSRKHHRLQELADFIPSLSSKDVAILEALTHFVYWAGKYPDPGSKREADATSVFDISEANEISAKELFQLAAKVMRYSKSVVAEHA